MSNKIINSNEMLSQIYKRLIENCLYKNPKDIKRDIQNIIKALILRKLLDYYKAPKTFYFVLDNNAEERLKKHLIKLHKQNNESVSDEYIREEIANINSLMDQVIQQILAEGDNND